MKNQHMLWLFFLAILFHISSGRNSREILKQFDGPFLETYWESYMSYPYNSETCYTGIANFEPDDSAYGYDLRFVPVEGSSSSGVNIINIAFAYPADDNQVLYSCSPYIAGLHLYEENNLDDTRILDLQNAVQELQAQGALVKMAYGGEEWGNTRIYYSSTQSSALAVVSRMVDDVQKLGLDGLDLAQEFSYGGNFDLSSPIQLYILKELRESLPDKIISYTFPSSPANVPFYDVLVYGHQYLDYVSVYHGDIDDVETILSYGVPMEKIVLSDHIGCDGGIESVEQARELARTVKDGGYPGLSFWSITKDTDHRTGETGCTVLQTGYTDGGFTEAFYEELNS